MSRVRILGNIGLAAIVATCVGCGRQDKQCLERIGKKIAGGIQSVTAQLTDTVGFDLQKRVLPDDLRGRVAKRVRWDSLLEKEKISVHLEKGVVRLEGTVADLSAKRRAVDLAQSTVGVQKVDDELKIDASE